MVIPRPLVTVLDWERFILAYAPVRSVEIVNNPGLYSVTITVRWKPWVLRRGRALRRLEDLLAPERPPGLLMTVRSC